MSARTTAVLVGALFWVSNISTVVGSVITGPIPNAAGVLAHSYPNESQVVAGTLIAHINDAAIIGYAVLLFPILKRFGEGLALGYVAFKVVEAVLLLVSAAVLLSLIGRAASYTARDVVEVTLAQQFWTMRLAALAYIVATPILNYMLYRSLLVPRFISIWGLVGVALLALGLALGVGDPTRGFQPGQLLVIPILLWELFFATWLIVRGFNPSALTPESAIA